jgi:hypothetical protein
MYLAAGMPIRKMLFGAEKICRKPNTCKGYNESNEVGDLCNIYKEPINGMDL